MSSLQTHLIEISDTDFLIIYHVDIITSTYTESLRINIDFLTENEYCNFFEARDMADSIIKHLMPGTYFFVYKNFSGTEWWTEIVLPKEKQIKN